MRVTFLLSDRKVETPKQTYLLKVAYEKHFDYEMASIVFAALNVGNVLIDAMSK